MRLDAGRLRSLVAAGARLTAADADADADAAHAAVGESTHGRRRLMLRRRLRRQGMPSPPGRG